MKKSIIYELKSEKLRSFRLGFTKYVSEKYGVNINTAYAKLRRGRIKRWETEGILGCMAEYSPKYIGRPEDFYESLPVKLNFVRFMHKEYGMGEKTAWKRFSNFDFTELELKGLNKVYREYMIIGGINHE